MVKKLIVSIMLLVLLVNVVLALPPPPPAPGGFGESADAEVAAPAAVEEEVFNEELQDEFKLATTSDAKINNLEKRITSLEEKISEMDSAGLSTPMIMVLIINLIMLIVFIYMLFGMLKPKQV